MKGAGWLGACCFLHIYCLQFMLNEFPSFLFFYYCYWMEAKLLVVLRQKGHGPRTTSFMGRAIRWNNFAEE